MKYLHILLSSFIVFAANAAPQPKDVNVVKMPAVTGSVTIDNAESNPVPITVTNGSGMPSGEYRFVGVTTQTVQGMFGINSAQIICKNQFGDGTRMCTTAEVFNSPNLGDILAPGDEAWVRSTIVSTFWSPINNTLMYVDSTGVEYREANCNQWTNSSSDVDGLMITTSPDGTLVKARVTNCARSLAIACCAAQ